MSSTFLLDFGTIPIVWCFFFHFYQLLSLVYMYGNMIYIFHKTPLSVPNSWFKKMKISHWEWLDFSECPLFFNNKTHRKSKCCHFFFLRSIINIHFLALGKRKVVSFPRIPVIVAVRSEDPFRKHLWYSLILNVEKVKIVIFASYFF